MRSRTKPYFIGSAIALIIMTCAIQITNAQKALLSCFDDVPLEVNDDVIFDVHWWESDHRRNAKGTANDIGFCYYGSNWGPGVNTDGKFVGFSDKNYHNPPLETSDRIHIWDEDSGGVFYFDKVVDNLLLYLRINEQSPQPDPISFGFKPEIVSGDVKIYEQNDAWIFEATTTCGGLIYFSEISSDIIRFTSPDITDGNCVDIALYPNPPRKIQKLVKKLIRENKGSNSDSTCEQL